MKPDLSIAAASGAASITGKLPEMAADAYFSSRAGERDRRQPAAPPPVAPVTGGIPPAAASDAQDPDYRYLGLPGCARRQLCRGELAVRRRREPRRRFRKGADGGARKPQDRTAHHTDDPRRQGRGLCRREALLHRRYE